MAYKLRKSMWGGYYNLSVRNSALYDQLKDSTDPKDILIVELILELARASDNAHRGASQ